MLKVEFTFSKSECEEIAKLHMRSLSGSLISQLGFSYASAFYRYLTRSTQEKVFLVKEGDKIISVCVLSLSPWTLQRRLLLWTPLLVNLPQLLGRVPWKKKLREFFRGRNSEPNKKLRTPRNKIPELILIYTDQQRRGAGHGKVLLEHCERYLREEKHINVYTVKTEADPKNKAPHFYLANGFNLL